VAVLVDITARKREEEERQAFQAKLQHAQKLESLGVLAGGIAHDFNNLLMAILGNADLALELLSPESPGREYVEKIETTAQRAAGLTNQMLAYSGKGRFLIQSIQLDRLVGEMAHLLETVISKKAELRMKFEPDLPAVEADASQVRQIVMNLITNGSEALGDANGQLTIATGTVEADRAYLSRCYLGDEVSDGTYVFLEVSDTGEGMDEETRKKIFDPFFTTKFTGRGLGLAAVLGIVRGHNGTINVYSEPGLGSSFKVLLPASERKVDDRPETPARTEGTLEGATILVVEDDAAVLDVTSLMLEKAGFRVLTATNGQEGVDLFRLYKDDIGLVVLDMTMPVMDGEEAFRGMRDIDPGVRVLLSSGYNEQDATNRFAGKGLAGFIQKPYRSVDLLNRVREILEPT
jgi:nitrogen-specific signal transduction histidine kinase